MTHALTHALALVLLLSACTPHTLCAPLTTATGWSEDIACHPRNSAT